MNLSFTNDKQPCEFLNESLNHFNKKTILGFGLLLIDLGKDSSTFLFATVATNQHLNFETK